MKDFKEYLDYNIVYMAVFVFFDFVPILLVYKTLSF